MLNEIGKVAVKNVVNNPRNSDQKMHIKVDSMKNFCNDSSSGYSFRRNKYKAVSRSSSMQQLNKSDFS